MPLDDRDAKFEKALSGHFRAECPDAETLAAYHERALATEEMIRWKKHIAGCGACQEILAQLEITEHLPLETNEAVHAFEMAPEAQRELARTRSLAVGRPGQAADLGQAMARPRAAEMPKRAAPWRWAAPVGAIAAGLLVWLTVHDMRETSVVLQGPVAEKRAEAPAAAPAEENEKARARSLDQTTASKLEAGQPRAKVPLQAPLPSLAQEKNGALGKGQRQDAAASRELQSGDELGRIQAKVEAREQAPRKNENVLPERVSRAQENEPEVAQNQVVVVPAAPPSPPASSAADEKKKAPLGLMAAQGAAGGKISSNYNREAYLRDVDSSGLYVISSPGGKAIWRVGANGLILRSTEKSAEWKPQASGVSAELTGGSASSEKVCWLVGRAGTILLSTDGGETWRKLASPVAGDLGGIQAGDAQHAVIWDAANRFRFETSDGGNTWKPVTSR